MRNKVRAELEASHSVATSVQAVTTTSMLSSQGPQIYVAACPLPESVKWVSLFACRAYIITPVAVVHVATHACMCYTYIHAQHRQVLGSLMLSTVQWLLGISICTLYMPTSCKFCDELWSAASSQ